MKDLFVIAMARQLSKGIDRRSSIERYEKCAKWREEEKWREMAGRQVVRNGGKLCHVFLESFPPMTIDDDDGASVQAPSNIQINIVVVRPNHNFSYQRIILS